MSNVWHLVTGEYPPRCGGVGDYTAALAAALAAAGDTVHVWTPAAAGESSRGVTVHVLPDAFGLASREMMAGAWADRPGVVLLQYVAHAFGARGANVAFCRWFARQRRHVADLRVMVHEPYFYFTPRRPWAPGNALAVVQRLMARLVVGAASRVYFSTDTWSRYLHAAPRPVTLPIPSNIPATAPADAVARARTIASSHDTAAPLVGHFGTYGAHIGGELMAILPLLVQRVPGVRLALLGDGGPAFRERFDAQHPETARRIWASGRLEEPAVAATLRACDVLLQPYPDGITTRRTSVMAGLRSGMPIVSTHGALTERVWDITGAVALAAAGDAAGHVDLVRALLRDPDERAALGARAAAAYAARFSMEHTIAILRDPAAA